MALKATGTAPSYWEEIRETPTRASFVWGVEGQSCGDMCAGGQFASMHRRNQDWVPMKFDRIQPTEIPEQLQAIGMDPAFWAIFAKDVKQRAKTTFPPPCRACCISWCSDACCCSAYRYIENGRLMVLATVQAWEGKMAKHGVKMTHFDKTGSYYTSASNGFACECSYGKHYVYGFFLEPQQAVAAASMEIQVSVPAGTKAGALLACTTPDGKQIQVAVPEDYPTGGVISVRV